MRKNGHKCLKKPENQQYGAQKTLNSGLYLKILMPAAYQKRASRLRCSFVVDGHKYQTNLRKPQEMFFIV